MLVHHLGHRIPQLNHVLVKRLDLPLELDTIHQINGDGHVLAAQCVQKRVLEELPFVAHDILRVQKLIRCGRYHMELPRMQAVRDFLSGTGI